MVNSPLLVEVIGEAGWDAIMIDQRHGLGGHEDMVRCLTAARAAGTAALVRVANNEHGLIGRVLDAGVQGIACPLVNSAADAERLVCAVLEYARPLVDAGWDMVAAGTDLGWFSAAAGDVIRQLKPGR